MVQKLVSKSIRNFVFWPKILPQMWSKIWQSYCLKMLKFKWKIFVKHLSKLFTKVFWQNDWFKTEIKIFV